MNVRRVWVACAVAGAAWMGFPRGVAAKEKPPVEKPKSGLSQLTATPPIEYTYMAVPEGYDPKKWYPLVFLLHSISDVASDSKPEPFVGAWADVLLKRGWIIAAPKLSAYDNETSAPPLLDALKKVMTVYHVDDRRVVVCGHNAGGCMAWNFATRYPDKVAGVMSFSGEIRSESYGALKGLAGKKAYLFRGTKDTFYTAGTFKGDRARLEAFKIEVTALEKPDWELAMPVPELPKIAEWIDGVYPVGEWRAKADAAEKALAAKDFAGTARALAELAAELKKAPYPAFEQKAAAIGAGMLDAARASFEEAKQGVEGDPLGALARMEEAAKAVKGVKVLEEEAKKATALLAKLPAVVEAVKKKEAEVAGAAYMEKAAAAEAKGDLALALAHYRKAAALALFGKKDEAAAKVSELEPKVGAK